MDEQGRRIDQLGAKEVTDNDVSQNGWLRCEAVTPALPAKAVLGRLYIGVASGKTGKALVGDCSVTQISSEPRVVSLQSSAYRDLAASGRLDLAATFFASPVKYPEDTLRGIFEIEGTDNCRRIPADVFGEGEARAAIDVSMLKEGKSKIGFRLERADGTLLGELVFTRVGALPERKVFIDSQKRTVVDGKPFFPLGMFWPQITQDRIAIYTNSPFNCIMPYNDINREHFDWCHQAGLKVLCHVSGRFRELSEATPEKRLEIEERHFNGVVRALRDHPSILAWYLADEAPLKYADILTARKRSFQSIDPDHPTWIVLDKVRHVRGMMDGYDVIGVDPYPVGNRGWPDVTNLGMVSEWTRDTDRAVFGMRPMWIVPQAFDWAWYPKGDMEGVEMRLPTRCEMANMSWQAIAAGANGLVYFSFGSLVGKLPTGPRFDSAWTDVVAVAREVKSVESILLSDAYMGRIVVPENLVARAWQGDRVVYLLLVNRTVEPVSAVVKLPFAVVGVQNAVGKGVELQGHDALSVSLDPMGYGLVTLR